MRHLTPASQLVAVLLLLVLSPSFELLGLLVLTNSVVSLHVWDDTKQKVKSWYMKDIFFLALKHAQIILSFKRKVAVLFFP